MGVTSSVYCFTFTGKHAQSQATLSVPLALPSISYGNPLTLLPQSHSEIYSQSALEGRLSQDSAQTGLMYLSQHIPRGRADNAKGGKRGREVVRGEKACLRKLHHAF